MQNDWIGTCVDGLQTRCLHGVWVVRGAPEAYRMARGEPSPTAVGDEKLREVIELASKRWLRPLGQDAVEAGVVTVAVFEEWDMQPTHLLQFWEPGAHSVDDKPSRQELVRMPAPDGGMSYTRAQAEALCRGERVEKPWRFNGSFWCKSDSGDFGIEDGVLKVEVLA